ncbi:MAG: UDP-N-acetylmuramate dehydrogenase [Planctomycetaceae bacterium]|nr:UDP-N-acetylmuramate dehydrogenase [Planctomycetaceae bacterium]
MVAVHAFDTFLAERRISVRVDELLGPYTTMKVGGPADYFVEPRSPEELAAAFKAARECELPVRILGSGANLLVRDEGVRGVVVRLTHLNRRDGLHVEAGYNFAKLVKETAAEGLGGLECLAGIPAQVGGAVRMNAGGRHGETSAAVKYVDVLGPDGELRRLTRDQVGFRYRGTQLGDAVVLAAGFDLRPADGIRERYEDVLSQKKSSQPLGTHNAGCMFKNPPGGHAGRIIDECGLKGLRVGNAHVSEKHANFIENDGGATAADILALVERIQARAPLPLELEVLVW